MYQYKKSLTKADVKNKFIQISKEGLSCFPDSHSFDLICPDGHTYNVNFKRYSSNGSEYGRIIGISCLFRDHSFLKEDSEVYFEVNQEQKKVYMNFDISPNSSLSQVIPADYEKNVCDLLEPILSHGFNSLLLCKQGREFPVKGDNGKIIGNIDFLCIDSHTKDYVVIEVKVEDTRSGVVGQIKGYMNWVKANIADKKGVKVRGVILINEQNENAKLELLEYAAKGMTDISLLFYKIEFSLYRDSKCTLPCK